MADNILNDATMTDLFDLLQAGSFSWIEALEALNNNLLKDSNSNDNYAAIFSWIVGNPSVHALEDKEGDTLLHIAASALPEHLKILLEKANCRDLICEDNKRGFSPLFYLMQNTAFTKPGSYDAELSGMVNLIGIDKANQQYKIYKNALSFYDELDEHQRQKKELELCLQKLLTVIFSIAFEKLNEEPSEKTEQTIQILKKHREAFAQWLIENHGENKELLQSAFKEKDHNIGKVFVFPKKPFFFYDSEAKKARALLKEAISDKNVPDAWRFNLPFKNTRPQIPSSRFSLN